MICSQVLAIAANHKKRSKQSQESKTLQMKEEKITLFLYTFPWRSTQSEKMEICPEKTQVLHLKKSEELIRERPIQDYFLCNNVAAVRFVSPSEAVV